MEKNQLRKDLLEFCRIYEYCQSLVDCHMAADLDDNYYWKQIFNMIFTDKVVYRANELYPFTWEDPDTSYEDDVRSFMSGFTAAHENVKKLLKNLPE